MYGEITNPSQILGQIDELHPLVGYLNNGIPNVNLYGTDEPTSDIGVDGQIYIQDVEPPVMWVKVNGSWEKGSSEIDLDKDLPEVTYAEYLAIPEEERKDKIYFITDINQGGGGSAPTPVPSTHTYSTEEQVVGTWIDGKPVYEKSVELYWEASAMNFNVDMSEYLPPNIKNYVNVSGFITYTAGETSVYGLGQYLNFPYANKYNLSVTVGSGRATDISISVTARYTKTTD